MFNLDHLVFIFVCIVVLNKKDILKGRISVNDNIELFASINLTHHSPLTYYITGGEYSFERIFCGFEMFCSM